MKKVVVSFDQKATEIEIEIYNEFVEKMAKKGITVKSIGGGIKNPK